MARSHRPNLFCLEILQKHSTRGWVYRQEEGWIFAELTPDELAEFKSYRPGITIPRMSVRLPYSQAAWFTSESDYLVNWFALCIIPPQAYPLVSSRFQVDQITGDELIRYTRHARNSIEAGSYKTWLWADEVQMCRKLGCKVTLYRGWGWDEWGVPLEWNPPLQYKEHIFIYAFINELTHEVYVGLTENLERRQIEHVRDTKNSDKAALLQSLRAQGYEPNPTMLEEVAGEKARERERYWTAYYKSQGYKITNHDYRSLSN